VDIGNAKRGKGWKLKKQAWIEKSGSGQITDEEEKTQKNRKKFQKRGCNYPKNRI
jgi:hypothetical protein